MTRDAAPNFGTRDDSLAARMLPIVEEFEAALRRGEQPALDEYLTRGAEPDRTRLRAELERVREEWRGQAAAPDQPTPSDQPASRDQPAPDQPAPDQPAPSDQPPLDRQPPSANLSTVRGDATDPIGDRTAQIESSSNGTESPVGAAAQRLPAIPGYEILCELGRGGMGVVYMARQKSLGRVVALKMIRGGQHASAQERARFRTEAESVARLQHGNIVQIFDIGEHDGQPFLSLEFVGGGSLDQMQSGRPMPGRDAARLAETLARAVHSAHLQGIVHRDLKPTNVLLTADGVPKISDFGLAKRLDGQSGQTQSGAVVGTPSYMAPEQAAGKSRDVGPATDVYALGAILYELLTGKPPFKGATPYETVRLVQTADPVPPSRRQAKVHRDIETICLKAMSKEPSRRYESALALAEDLARYVASEPILARREGPARRAWRRIRRHPIAATGVLLCALAVVPVALTVRSLGQAAAVSSLVNDIDARTSALSQDFTRADLDAIGEQLARLDDLDPQKASAASERLVRRVEEHVRALFGRRMDEKTGRAIESALAWMATRDATRAAALRTAFDERRHRWETVFDLSAPDFSELGSVFEPGTALAGPGALVPFARASPVVPTRVPCDANVELRAVLEHPAWTEAPELGLLLDSRDADGYAFFVRTSAPPAPGEPQTTPVTFAEARQRGAAIWLAIVRNKRVLRQRQQPARQLGDGPLALVAKREGMHLAFQANDLEIAFDDLFVFRSTPPGVFAVHWPARVGLAHLKALSQQLSPVASALERGDEHYVHGRYAEALDEYRRAALGHTKVDLTQEARTKEGLCLLQLRRDKEAVDALTAVVEQPGQPWPDLARALLWVGLLRTNKLKDADAELEVLLRTATLKDLVTLIPKDVLEAIWQTFVEREGGLNAVMFDLSHLPRLEMLVQAAEQLEFDAKERALIRMALCLGYRWRQDPESAIKVLEELLRHGDEVSALNAMELPPVRDYCWLLREIGQKEKALAVMDQYLVDENGAYRKENIGLLVERARIYASLGQPDKADEDLAELFRRVRVEDMSYVQYSSACLVRGFALEDRGDKDGARAAWREGLFKNFLAHGGRREVGRDPIAGIRAGIGVYQGMMLGSLCNELSVEEAIDLTSVALPFATEFVFSLSRKDLPLIPASIYLGAWQSEEAKREARQIVYLELPLYLWVRAPFVRYSRGLMQYGAFRDGLSAEQELVVRELAARVFDFYFTSKASRKGFLSHAVFAKVAWSRPFGSLPSVPEVWKRLKAEVDPSIRGPVAYVLGRRYLQVGVPASAEFFFRAALEDAAEGSTLGRLAREELDKLTAK